MHKANIVKMTPANVAPTVSVMRVMVGGSSGSTGGGGAAGTAGADILVAYFLGEFFGGLPFLRPRIGGLDFVAVSWGDVVAGAATGVSDGVLVEAGGAGGGGAGGGGDGGNGNGLGSRGGGGGVGGLLTSSMGGAGLDAGLM